MLARSCLQADLPSSVGQVFLGESDKLCILEFFVEQSSHLLRSTILNFESHSSLFLFLHDILHHDNALQSKLGSFHRVVLLQDTSDYQLISFFVDALQLSRCHCNQEKNQIEEGCCFDVTKVSFSFPILIQCFQNLCL